MDTIKEVRKQLLEIRTIRQKDKQNECMTSKASLFRIVHKLRLLASLSYLYLVFE